MSIRTELRHDEATQNLADSLAELVAAEFCTGSDALGPDGWRVVAGTCRLLGAAFAVAAETLETEGTS